MNTSDKGLNEIMESEGCKLVAYADPGTGGDPWTIAVGHTKGVRPGDTCTREQAMAWLREDIKDAEAAVLHRVKVPLAQGQFDALVSFVFNVGEGNFASSTLLKLLNARDYRGAADQFPRWNQGGGRVLPGLVTRRARERSMFLEGVE